MRPGLANLLRRTTASNAPSKTRSLSSISDDASSTAAVASFDATLKSVLLLLHPDAVHGHPHAERANAEAFKELRQWSEEVEKGSSGSRRRRRLSFFVRDRDDNGTETVSSVSATLPPPSAARLSKDPSKLLLPLMIAAGLAEKDGEYLEEDEYSFDEERRRRSRYQASTSSFGDDLDDATLAALRRPAEFFAAAARASAARRSKVNDSSPLLLDAARRRAAMRIVHGVTVRYGEGFSPNSSSSSSSSPSPPPSPQQALEAVRRLAEVVEGFSEGGEGLLRGTTIFLVRRRRRREGKGGSDVDLESGTISLDVCDGDEAWRDVLSEASDPVSGSAALRASAERLKELEQIAARALGVESVSLLLRRGEEEEGEDDDEEESNVRETISRYDALVQQLASAPLPSGDSTQQQRRHAGVNVVVVGSTKQTTAASATTIIIKADASPLDVFSAVESLGPALSSRHLESQKAKRATQRLLDAAALKLGARELKVSADDDGGDRDELDTSAAAALAARILRAPESSGITGIARKFPAKVDFCLGRKNAVSADGMKVTLGADFEV